MKLLANMWPFHKKKLAEEGDRPLQRFLSPLDLDEIKSLGGLPSEAVVGQYLDPSLTLESFRPNPVFIDFMHRVLSAHASECTDFVAAASEMRIGHLCVIDWRTPEGPSGNVPPEDIIGAVEVHDGRIVEGSYHPNPNYRVLTQNGMTKFTPSQRAAFVRALSLLPRISQT